MIFNEKFGHNICIIVCAAWIALAGQSFVSAPIPLLRILLLGREAIRERADVVSYCMEKVSMGVMYLVLAYMVWIFVKKQKLGERNNDQP